MKAFALYKEFLFLIFCITYVESSSYSVTDAEARVAAQIVVDSLNYNSNSMYPFTTYLIHEALASSSHNGTTYILTFQTELDAGNFQLHSSKVLINNDTKRLVKDEIIASNAFEVIDTASEEVKKIANFYANVRDTTPQFSVLVARRQLVNGFNYFLTLQNEDGTYRKVTVYQLFNGPMTLISDRGSGVDDIEDTHSSIPGGINDVSVTDPDVISAANFLLDFENKQSPRIPFTLYEISSCKLQVTDRFAYYLTIHFEKDAGFFETHEALVFRNMDGDFSVQTDQITGTLAHPEVDIDSIEVKRTAEFAFTKINGGTSLAIDGIVTARKQLVNGYNYFLTFKQKNNEGFRKVVVYEPFGSSNTTWSLESDVATISLVVPDSPPPLIGAYERVDTTDPIVVKAANTIIANLNSRINSLIPYTLFQILNAEKQIVSGTNYRITMIIELDAGNFATHDSVVYCDLLGLMAIRSDEQIASFAHPLIDSQSEIVKNITLTALSRMYFINHGLSSIITARRQLVHGFNYFLTLKLIGDVGYHKVTVYRSFSGDLSLSRDVVTKHVDLEKTYNGSFLNIDDPQVKHAATSILKINNMKSNSIIPYTILEIRKAKKGLYSKKYDGFPLILNLLLERESGYIEDHSSIVVVSLSQFTVIRDTIDIITSFPEESLEDPKLLTIVHSVLDDPRMMEYSEHKLDALVMARRQAGMNDTKSAPIAVHYLTFKLVDLDMFFKVVVLESNVQGSTPSLKELRKVSASMPCIPQELISTKNDPKIIIIIVLALALISLSFLFGSYIYRNNQVKQYDDGSVSLVNQDL